MTSAPSSHELLGDVRISSYCRSTGCVGVATAADGVVVVDTKTADAASLRFTHAEWAAFVAGVKAGEFDLP